VMIWARLNKAGYQRVAHARSFEGANGES
jgi:hypothetical protein